jgi:UDP-GlcNAc3NAcA epimerase
VQKESHFFARPCIVLRKETEWVELVKNGTVKLADADPEKIRKAWDYLMNNREILQYPAFYGDGKAASSILKEITTVFRS